MLRITTHTDSAMRRFQLEGRLAGPWVKEVRDCWETAPLHAGGDRVLFDLTGLTYIDSAGKELLKQMHLRGAEFRAAGCLMRAVVEEIRLPRS